MGCSTVMARIGLLAANVQFECRGDMTKQLMELCAHGINQNVVRDSTY